MRSATQLLGRRAQLLVDLLDAQPWVRLANPNGTHPRALDREARSIRAELKRSGYRDRFNFETRWAVEPMDLLRELRELRPTVVRFSGHGGEDGLLFQAPDGRAQLVTKVIERSRAATSG